MSTRNRLYLLAAAVLIGGFVLTMLIAAAFESKDVATLFRLVAGGVVGYLSASIWFAARATR